MHVVYHEATSVKKALLETPPLSLELHMIDKDLEGLVHNSFLYSTVLLSFSGKIPPMDSSS